MIASDCIVDTFFKTTNNTVLMQMYDHLFLVMILQNREKKGKMGKMIYKFNNASLKFITFVLKV